MSEQEDILIASTKVAKAAVDAAKITSDAVETARSVVSEAAKKAAEIVKDNNAQTTKTLADALREVFNENIDSKRFIDVSKIPLICQSIVVMHTDISEIKDTLKWIARLVVGAVVLAIIASIYIKIK